MKQPFHLIAHKILLALLVAFPTLAARAAAPTVLETVDVALVPSGHPVNFCLLSHGQDQYIGFYDKERRLTIGKRRLGDKSFALQPLRAEDETLRPAPQGKWSPAVTNWDSHNSIAMAIDSTGHLHIAGNMHVHPLVYFRTEKPGDLATIRQIKSMVGEREDRCTYPRFLTGPRGELVFAYRHGRSGDGVDVYNVYDPAARAWKRLIDQPLLSGQGKCNAYSSGPTKGPDGCYHLVWVWRDTPDCSTNHDVCYARSKDLVTWETSAGKALTLPIVPGGAEVIDPVPPRGGIINGSTKIGFDDKGRVIVSYHKYDAAGNTQLYNARREESGWNIVQTSNWDYRWEFSGGGSIQFEISIMPVALLEGGKLVQVYGHRPRGSGGWYLDPQTLKPTGPYTPPARWPRQLAKVESVFPGMHVHLLEDRGTPAEKNVRYVMRWETLPANRDRPRQGELPEPSMLKVYKVGH